MDAQTHALFTLLHYTIMIRDTLEYCTEKPQYDVNIYKQRKEILLGMLDNKTQLSDFLANNGETGKKINDQLHEFIDDIYGDNSTVLRVGSEGLRVDKSQHIKIYHYVFGLHETVLDILNGYIKYGQEHGHDDPEFDQACETNNQFYRGVAYMVLCADLNKLFKEFNDAMRDSHGQPSPQSNFITNDIQQVVSFMAFVRQHSACDHGQPKENRELCDIFDKTEEVIKYMNGTNKVPEGQQLFTMMDDNFNYIKSYVAIKEKENMASLTKMFTDAAAFERQMIENQKKAEADAAVKKAD